MQYALIHCGLGAIGGALAMLTGRYLGTRGNLLLWGGMLAALIVAIMVLGGE